MSNNHDPEALALHAENAVPHPTRDRGNWFQTASGRAFYPIDPDAGEVFIGDIAHALSHVCRFGGHCKDFYSVAQHCLLVSLQLAPEKELNVLASATSPMGKAAYKNLVDLGLAGLLHDAAEAYVGDMVSPIKHSKELRAFRQVEDAVERAIFERFALYPQYRASSGLADGAAIKEADRRMLFTEKRDLRGESAVPPSLKWEDVEKYPPYEDLVVRPQPSAIAREGFLERFSDLWERKTGSAWGLG